MRMNRSLVSVVLIVLFFAAGTTLVEPADIEKDQEAIALSWVKAHNAASVDAMAAFREKHFQRSEVADWQPGYERMVEEFGKLEVYGVMIDGPGRLMVGVHPEKMEGKVRLVFEFHEDAPEQLQQVSLNAGGPGEGQGDDLPAVDFSSDWKARQAELNAYLGQLADDGLFSGAVLVAQQDGVRFAGAYGLASREFSAPNNLETRFDVGSCNKDYTQVAIMQLLAQGKLALDDTVGKHLPDYPNQVVRDQVTIQQLLDHRSGLGDYFTDEYWQTPMSRLRHTEDYIPIWGPKELLHEPGERELYSNYGYTVLGGIIEKLSGRRYADYVMEKIFEPAGMTSSGFFETDEVVPNVAVGYTYQSAEGRLEKPIKNIYLEPAKGGPWGKSFSTAHDLYRFYAAMMEGRVLEGEANWLAGSWESGAFALAGGGPGLNAMVYVEGGLMVVVLANMDPPIAGTLAESLSRDLRP